MGSINFQVVQGRLMAAAMDCGIADGVPGQKTYSAILAYVAGHKATTPTTDGLGLGMASHAAAYAISATVARLANFIGQGAEETAGFTLLHELWGPTPAQVGYEGRKDLGNTTPGDGRLFLGRGVFQLTGRANYAHFGTLIGVPLEQSPALAERPDIAVWTACEFWQSRGLSVYADTGQEDMITHRINGGTNGIAARRDFVTRAKHILT